MRIGAILGYIVIGIVGVQEAKIHREVHRIRDTHAAMKMFMSLKLNVVPTFNG